MAPGARRDTTNLGMNDWRKVTMGRYFMSTGSIMRAGALKTPPRTKEARRWVTLMAIMPPME